MKNLQELTSAEYLEISGGTTARGWGNWIGNAVGRIVGCAVNAAEEAYDFVKNL